MAICLRTPLNSSMSGQWIDVEYGGRNIWCSFFGTWEAMLVVCGACFVVFG